MRGNHINCLIMEKVYRKYTVSVSVILEVERTRSLVIQKVGSRVHLPKERGFQPVNQ